MRSSGRVITACLAFMMLAPVLALANGLYVPQVGTQASAMGGAFIGYADDYSAVHWNPAGIVKVQGTEATLGVHDAMILASRDGTIIYTDPVHTPDNWAIQNVYATSATQHDLAPGFFLYSDAGPLSGLFSKVGICGYTLVSYGVKWNALDIIDDFESHPSNYNNITRLGDAPSYESAIRGYVIAPVLARKFTDRLSIGVSGQAMYASFKLTNGGWIPTGEVYNNPPAPVEYNLYLDPYEMTEDLTGWGYGATLGILFDATDQIHVGVTARSPIKVAFDGDVKVTSTLAEYTSPSQTESFDLTFPMWAGAGIAYSDFLFEGTVLTADAQWTQWSKVQEIVRTVGTELPDDLGTTPLKWEDTVEFGLGMDYRVSRSTSVRLGYRLMPSPVPDETVDFVMPMSTKSAFSFGVGYRSDVWTLDASVVYQSGEKRQITGTETMNGKHLDDMLVPSLSFTYGF